MVMQYFYRFLISIFILGLLSLGVIDYLQNIESNECSMTYMLQSPDLIPVKLSKNIEKKFRNYNLYLYCEGNFDLFIQKFSK